MNGKLSSLALLVLVLLAGPASAQSASSPGRVNPFYAMDTSFNRPGLTAPQQMDLVKQLGYAGIAWTEQAPDQVKSTLGECEKRGLKMFTIYCAAQVNPNGDLTYSPELPRLMDTLKGHGTIIWLHLGGQGPALDRLTGREPLVQKLRALADMAAANGLRIAIYPHFGEWTARFGDATRLAKVVRHPQFGVTFNLCHCLAAGDERQIPQLLEQAGPMLLTVTLCGAETGVTGPQWNRLIQTLDKGSFDVGTVLRALDKAAFTGPIGYQGYGINGDARSILAPTMAAWQKLSAGQARKD
ncbi:MAG: sugar phosphate isomerase/epimerase family protein [Thermoguttaceae bacterium]